MTMKWWVLVPLVLSIAGAVTLAAMGKVEAALVVSMVQGLIQTLLPKLLEPAPKSE